MVVSQNRLRHLMIQRAVQLYWAIAVSFILMLFGGLLSYAHATPARQIAVQCDSVSVPEEECLALVALYDSTDGPHWFNTNTNEEIPQEKQWSANNDICTWEGITCEVVPADSKIHVTALHLKGLNLRGTIPVELGDLDYLRDMILLKNQLTGGIPAELGGPNGLSSLVRLDLSQNTQLGGLIPGELGQIEPLKRFSCTTCGLEGNVPVELGALGLDVLNIWGNPKMAGKVPVYVWDIPVLTLSITNLSGEMPSKLKPNTIWFDVHNSCFTGSIPIVDDAYTQPDSGLLEAFGDLAFGVGSAKPVATDGCPSAPSGITVSEFQTVLSDLQANGTAAQFGQFHFSNVDITAVPEEIRAFQGLRQLSIDASQLTGPLSSVVWELPNLTHLGIAGSTITALNEPESLPARLSVVLLHHNQISGPLPDWLSKIENLETLYLNNNQFTGELPSWLCDGNYTSLSLMGNLFSGEIPECISQLSQLEVLTLGGSPQNPSRLGGPLPETFSALESLESLTIVHADINDTLDEIAGLPNLTALALQSNNFQGAISTFANAANLCLLNLYDNYLIGEIPSSLLGVGENCSAPELTVRLNALFIAAENDELKAFLNVRDPEWEQWQTVPPSNVRVEESFTTGIKVGWEPIPYKSGEGGYRIEAEATGPIPAYATECQQDQIASSDSKYAGSQTVSGLFPGTDYNIRVKTFTQANPPGAFAPFHSKTSLPSAPITGRTEEIGLLSLYMLALDSNLDEQYDDVLNAMQQASRSDTTEFTVALIDRRGDQNTEIVLIFGGCRVSLEGLPSLRPDGLVELDSQSDELDMTDGNALGAFVRWAIEEFAQDSSIPVVATYIGHGIAIAPQVDNLASIFSANANDEPVEGCLDSDAFCLLPNRQDINPGYWTDTVPDGAGGRQLRLITPLQLRRALEVGTNHGARPIAVLDVAHCFGGSIEELYELTYTDAETPVPMMDTIIASPSYTYFGDEVLKKTVVAPLLTFPSSTEKALAIVDSYEQALEIADMYDGNADVNHPRIIVPWLAEEIPTIKPAVDQLATALLNTEALEDLLDNAHTNAVKYDTTLCSECPDGQPDCPADEREQDWTIDEKDGLADLRDIARVLANSSEAPANVRNAAVALREAIDGAVIPVTDGFRIARRSGRIWYAPETSDPWEFSESAGGLSIFMDMVNQVYIEFDENKEPQEKRAASWQAYWYLTDPYAGRMDPLSNPNSYQFFAGESGWDDLLHAYWTTVRDEQKEEFLRARACLLTLQPLSKPIYNLYLPAMINYDRDQ
ncbi:MAG: fibronectin type III domain-containing protein [Caldilineaceae bacterium]|nr:fibronectin type III domain-containing protein [Caldilineaceae bacterium]